MEIGTGDLVWLIVWGSLYILVWLFQIIRYRCCRWRLFSSADDEEPRPTYWQKLKHDHFVLGIFFVHPDDPFTRSARIFIWAFNSVIVLTLTSIQFHKEGCIEEQSINWSINFIVRVVQGAVTSMLLVWLFRFDSILKRARQRSVQPCCLYDLCALATLAIVLPILLYFCSDFYHQCDVRFVMLKWAIALLIEYVISQPIMVWVEMHLLHKYDVFIPRNGGYVDPESPREMLQPFPEDDDDYDDVGLRRYLTSERTPLKRDLPYA
ncbi:uncharacterized protein ACA1_044690 [Acanthamoeba castellanii str. Neff]|uniref:Transmembrane protein n=1 Tax=Acanthamoeba castellanii (strain ATCC 30010 / Neff) TaxID=1257118 RepID=L8GYW4_ACACF|nr:uncharacterized protein ACA1_044690 [Acanthamoeba castellanii str. Neff]ELR18469.1 hypothetical protein ACA1_044690 [Acanthamoeba castellanii str. Neff]